MCLFRLVPLGTYPVTVAPVHTGAYCEQYGWSAVIFSQALTPNLLAWGNHHTPAACNWQGSLGMTEVMSMFELMIEGHDSELLALLKRCAA